MKTAALALALAVPALSGAQDLPSRIASVTVYEDRALVTRTARAALPAGRSSFRFTGLPPGLDERTLRAGLEGASARVVGLSSSLERTAAPADDRVKGLEAEIEALGDRIAAKGEEISALGVERRYLDAYRAFARAAFSEGTASAAAETRDWGKTLAFLRDRAQAGDGRAIALEKERRELQERQATLQRQLQQTSTALERWIRSAEVVVEAEKAGEAVLSCGYQIADASWSPVYDARFDPATRAVDLSYFGEIRQRTGEDWTEAAITLSTARPSQGAARPRLPALRLGGRKREPEREVRVQEGHELRDEVPAAPASPAEGPAGSPAPLSVVKDRGPSVTFEIRSPATIPSDGRAARVAIATPRLAPELSYEAVPKLRPYVFLKASQANGTGLPLLAGPVHVSRASGYVGTAALKFTAPGERFDLSLGVDEAVKVHRTVVRETAEAGKGLRNRQVLTRIYDFEVSNYSGAAQTVRLLDQVPVSKLESVQVELADATTPPSSRDADGILAWVLPLAHGEKRIVHLEFTVTMPENHRLP